MAGYFVAIFIWIGLLYPAPGWAKNPHLPLPPNPVAFENALPEIQDLDDLEQGLKPQFGRTELFYTKRAGQTLSLFGRELFSSGRFSQPSASGTIQDDYVLGSGDELSILIRGSAVLNLHIQVDDEGRVVVDRLRPLIAAGQSMKQFRAVLQEEAAVTIPGAQTYVSLAKVRRISVYILGEVARPGRHELTAFDSIIEALNLAGGIKAEGSLRRLQLVRKGQVQPVDLYQILVGSGNGHLPLLQEGDRLMVPPLGPTFAVTGDVKRPAVFELASESSLFMAEALALAGGSLQPSALRLTRLRFDSDGQEKAEEIAPEDRQPLQDGDIIVVSPRQTIRAGTVGIEGHVQHPGPRSLSEGADLSLLLKKADLQQNPYLSFAAVETTNPTDNRRYLKTIDLQKILNGETSYALKDQDILIVLAGADVAFLSSRSVLSALKGELISSADQKDCAGLSILMQVIAGDATGLQARSPLVKAARLLPPVEMDCPRIFHRYPDLLAFALNHSVLIREGVERPGIYPLAGSEPASSGREGKAKTSRIKSQASASLAEQITHMLKGGEMNSLPQEVVIEGKPTVEIQGDGAVQNTGVRALSSVPTLRHLLKNARLTPDIYPLFGFIDRFDESSLTRHMIPFSPQKIISGADDVKLKDHDRVSLFTNKQIAQLVERGKESDIDDVWDGLVGIEDTKALRQLVKDRIIEVQGAVHHPGRYPVADGIALSQVLKAAGGFVTKADVQNIEVTIHRQEDLEKDSLASSRTVVSWKSAAPHKISLNPGDAVQVPLLFSDQEEGTVSVSGEVRHPGTYTIRRGEMFSSLLKRAGGLTEQAFPEGAIFTRESARQQEEDGYVRTARELDRNLAAVVLKKEDAPSGDQIALARQLSEELRHTKALGRITVESDPDVLLVKPDLDILVEPEDKVVIPKRPLTVTVSGEVLSPASLQFKSGKTVRDYLEEAGGLTRYADSDRVFVLFPNGSAQPVSVSSWNYKPMFITPGCTIVVPRDPKPFDFLEMSKGVTGVLGQLALTAASLAVITRD